MSNIPSQRQQSDMVLLAYIRERQRPSLGSYVQARMTAELKELGAGVTRSNDHTAQLAVMH